MIVRKVGQRSIVIGMMVEQEVCEIKHMVQELVVVLV